MNKAVDACNDNCDYRRFEQLVEKLLQRTEQPCKDCLKDAGVAAQDINEVLLVGGMTRMPKVMLVGLSLWTPTARRERGPACWWLDLFVQCMLGRYFSSVLQQIGCTWHMCVHVLVHVRVIIFSMQACSWYLLSVCPAMHWAAIVQSPPPPPPPPSPPPSQVCTSLCL